MTEVRDRMNLRRFSNAEMTFATSMAEFLTFELRLTATVTRQAFCYTAITPKTSAVQEKYENWRLGSN